jgi:hypothetical protein
MEELLKRAPSFLVAVTALWATACSTDSPMQARSPGQNAAFTISDGGNNGSVSGFFWLTPTVKGGQKTFTGTFDADLSPSIDICRIGPISNSLPAASACTGPAIRTLSGPKEPEIIRVDISDENYSVNWKSTSDGIIVGAKYRAIVRVGSRVLGWLDMQGVEKQRDAGNVEAGFVGLVVGSPFLFKWRIETGIAGAVVVSPSAATITDLQTQMFTALVTDLHDNVLPGALVAWSIDNAAIAVLSPTTGTTDAAGTTSTTATPVLNVGGTTIVRAASQGLQGTATLTITVPCNLNRPDSDGDRLPNCAETGTHVFVNTLNTGTDANNADTDGDNIKDGDEVLGTLGGLNLPAMGVSALHKDILLEYDWFNDNADPGTCGAHSHRPTTAAITRVTNAFSSAPVSNPDGTTGIHLINDFGQGGAFTGGNLIADADGLVAGGLGASDDFRVYKAANFAANRNGYFHYVLNPHRYATTSSSSGLAEINGDDLIVSLQCFSSTVNTANTIMHELGHNIGLRHGGFEDQNYKPNYNSVMNYLYQFPGIDNDCTPPGNGVLSYSVGTRPPLNENNVDERQGVCGNPPGPGWDWNGNGNATDFGYARNLNPDWNAALSILQDYNDWAHLNLTGIGDANGLGTIAARTSSRSLSTEKEVVTCQDTPQIRTPEGE